MEWKMKIHQFISVHKSTDTSAIIKVKNSNSKMSILNKKNTHTVGKLQKQFLCEKCISKSFVKQH